MTLASMGVAGAGYADLPTPCLIVDLAILDANVARLAQFAKLRGVNLRPHAKTHKCSAIARRQIAAGAVGVSCSTIDEAETMVEAGIPGVLVTSPIVGAGKIARFVELVARAPDARTVVDDAEMARELASALEAKGMSGGVLIDVDVGQHRTGVQPDHAYELAKAIDAKPSLRLDGLQAYAGHIQHIVDGTQREAKARGVHETVLELRRQLAQFLPEQPIISGGGTGTHAFDASAPAFTELQAGSYVFMDVEYGDIAPPLSEVWPFATSLRLLTTVVSAPLKGQVTTDAGTKALATYGPPPRVMTEAFRNCAYGFSGDEHGCVTFADGHTPPAIGTLLECTVGHCDPTVAMFDRLYGMRDGKLAEVLLVDARGRRNRIGAISGR
jgi:D-serine deaminase-like pyridoxal phosphate-dependent protein